MQMDDRDNSAFVHDLRITINYIGTENLTALLRSSPEDANIDTALLNKLLDLLKMLADGQVITYRQSRRVLYVRKYFSVVDANARIFFALN